MKVTKEQIAEWKAKHGTIYELTVDGGKMCYVADPSSNLVKMKALMQAMLKGSFEYVDAFLAHCWLGGDEEIKTDDVIKTGMIEQVEDLVDIPEFDVQFKKDSAIITVEGKECKVRLATRNDLKYAEDRNKANKPLDTQIYLLERIAQSDLKEWRADNRLYMSLLLAVNQVKEKKYVAVKKL